MNPVGPNETEVASERNVSAGVIGAFNGPVSRAFDLHLVRTVDANYKLIVFMKIQFFFEDGSGGRWKDVEKPTFVSQWATAVKSAWGNRTLKTLKSGKKVTIDFRFRTQVEGWMMDHWEVTVTKVSKFARSSVNPLTGNVALDSLDLVMTPKSGNSFQRGVVHEFGHMLGLADEYHRGHPHAMDYRSVMNSGEHVLSRHDTPYMRWLEDTLKKLNIN